MGRAQASPGRGHRALRSAKLRLSILAAPPPAVAIPRLPPQSPFERGGCFRPYLYFSAASKLGAFTSQGEGASAHGKRKGGGGEGQPPSTSPLASRAAFCGGCSPRRPSHTPPLVPPAHVPQTGSPPASQRGRQWPPSPRDEHRRARGAPKNRPRPRRGDGEQRGGCAPRGDTGTRTPPARGRFLEVSRRCAGSPFQPGLRARTTGSPQQRYVSHCGPPPSASVSLSNSLPFHDQER